MANKNKKTAGEPIEINIYKKARFNAMERDPEDEEIRTAERASAELYINRERYLHIEQEDPAKRQEDPTPEEVLRMMERYDAPELRDHFCTHNCPLGKGRKPLTYDNLSKISAGLMSALYFLDDANDRLHAILSDCEVSAEEREEFEAILKTLSDIAYNANSLELWAKKNDFGGEQ